MTFEKLLYFWQKAATDLDLQIVVPFKFTLATGNHLEPILLVKQFGATNGMLIFGGYDQIASNIDELHSAGYGFCVLEEPLVNEEYNREDFVEMLKDWGWSGNEERPNWLE